MTPLTPLPARTLTVEKLAGRRGERQLFDKIELRLGPGEMAELRGPNGAGKTTLLLIVAGLVTPEAGRVGILGGDQEARPGTDIGLLGHRSGIKARLSVRENLEFWTALSGMTGGIEAALQTVGLLPIAGLEAGYLSAGQTRRLALARLIVAERPIWLMDEPTAALDAAGEALVSKMLDWHLDRGGLVLAATHHELGLRHGSRKIVLGQAGAAP